MKVSLPAISALHRADMNGCIASKGRAMPIRAENKVRYPKNWTSQIRPRILARSAHSYEPNEDCVAWPRCEMCAVFDRSWIERGATMEDWQPSLEGLEGSVYIILTIAHLSDEIEDCSDENLRAWCQLCHNRYDAPKRAAGIQARARAERASGDLFQCEGVS